MTVMQMYEEIKKIKKENPNLKYFNVLLNNDVALYETYKDLKENNIKFIIKNY